MGVLHAFLPLHRRADPLSFRSRARSREPKTRCPFGLALRAIGDWVSLRTFDSAGKPPREFLADLLRCNSRSKPERHRRAR